MKYSFVTFGCRLNRAETLDAEAALAAAGHELTRPGEDSDVIVVRGCSVTARAERDTRLRIAALKKRYPRSVVIATGCIPGAEKFDPAAVAAVPTRTARAYLKVQDGCSGRCAFCTVPKFRGGPVSVPFDAALARARAFLEAGYREIVITGCNLALYRSNGAGLGGLVAAIARLESPGHRVRLGSLEPGVCDEAVAEAFSENPGICRFLHLSMQSGSNRTLAAMGRPYTAEAVLAALERFRRASPDIAVGADFICGFPGESDADFARTLEFARAAGIVNAHVFPYSERPGTIAATMPGAVAKARRRERAAELSRACAVLRCAAAQRQLGQTVEVCVEKTGAAAEGFSERYFRCRVEGCAAPRRSLAKARVVALAGDILLAKPV